MTTITTPRLRAGQRVDDTYAIVDPDGYCLGWVGRTEHGWTARGAGKWAGKIHTDPAPTRTAAIERFARAVDHWRRTHAPEA